MTAASKTAAAPMMATTTGLFDGGAGPGGVCRIEIAIRGASMAPILKAPAKTPRSRGSLAREGREI
jgi:hypothetical protein